MMKKRILQVVTLVVLLTALIGFLIIDRNVFRGTQDALEKMLVQGGTEEAFAEEGASKDLCEDATDDEDLTLQQEIEEEILAGHCNLQYETEQIQVYSYNDANGFMLYIRAPEGTTVIHPVQNFLVDQERAALWLLENSDELQIRAIDLRQETFLEETLVLDENGIEEALADTYGLATAQGQGSFLDLCVYMSGREENGGVTLGGTVSGVSKETYREFEIVYEIDRESGEVYTKGYLQDLAIHPLYQEFLFHNLTVENPFAGNGTRIGEKLSFFDDEVYLMEDGKFQKQFAVADLDEDGVQELLFRLRQTDGKEDIIYVLAEGEGKLICQDIRVADATDNQKEKNGVQDVALCAAAWYDCASFIELPAENNKDYRSRDEVFAAVEEGDFSVVIRKYSDPEAIAESLKEAYELEGDSRRTVRCDIDEDGFDELLLLIQYDFEEYERICFVLDYRNGGAVCTYYDWCDGNEWLMLGEEGRLIHCLASNNGSCNYCGLMECTLNAGGIKEIDNTGEGLAVCDVYEPDEAGLWWWEGEEPEIIQGGIYFVRMRVKDEEEISDTGTAGGVVKKLIAKEQFLEKYKELTGEEFALDIDLQETDIMITNIEDGAFCTEYTKRESFLEDCGFQGEEPFYRYCDEDDGLQLEIYYHEGTGKGCGIRYYPGKDWEPQGFYYDVLKTAADDAGYFDAEYLLERVCTDPYELLARGGIDLSQDEEIEDYEEHIAYTSDGRPKHFWSQGWITYVGEEHEIMNLLDIKFTYREDGTLKRKDYVHNSSALETTDSVVHSFYDTQERLLYEDCYHTHGSIDYYYIYRKDGTMPSYCLVLDHNGGCIYADMVAVE